MDKTITDMMEFDKFSNLRPTDYLKESLTAFDIGDGLDDEQLIHLLTFFTLLEGSLTALGPKYYLATTCVRRKLDSLRSFKHSRETK